MTPYEPPCASGARRQWMAELLSDDGYFGGLFYVPADDRDAAWTAANAEAASMSRPVAVQSIAQDPATLAECAAIRSLILHGGGSAGVRHRSRVIAAAHVGRWRVYGRREDDGRVTLYRAHDGFTSAPLEPRDAQETARDHGRPLLTAGAAVLTLDGAPLALVTGRGMFDDGSVCEGLHELPPLVRIAADHPHRDAARLARIIQYAASRPFRRQRYEIRAAATVDEIRAVILADPFTYPPAIVSPR